MVGEKNHFNRKKEKKMEKYHLQCAGCCCTLYADPLEEGENWIYIMNGRLCHQCGAEKEIDDDDDFDIDQDGWDC